MFNGSQLAKMNGRYKRLKSEKTEIAEMTRNSESNNLMSYT